MKFTSLGLTASQFRALQDCPLFRGFTQEQLDRAVGHWCFKAYQEPAVLMLEGQPGDSMYLVLEGCAKIYCTDNRGKEMVIGYKSAGDLLGEMGFIDGIPRSATVEMTTPSALLWIDREAFRTHCRELPEVMDNLLKIITAQLRTTNARIQVLLASGTQCRVARLLVYLSYNSTTDTNSGSVPFKLSQSDIGTLTGLSRASVNAVLSAWKQRRYISVDNQHHITIHDLAALKQEAQ